MTTNLIIQEKTSALMDGEYSEHELDAILGELRSDEHKNEWEIYHRIGEILNSDDLSIELSTHFSEQLSSRLALEPIYLRPTNRHHFFVSHKIAYAVAAMFAFALVIIPKFAGQDGSETSAPYYVGQFSVVSSTATLSRNLQPKAELAALSDAQVRNTGNRSNHPASNADSKMLRDPLLDSYLAAHQHYSNSMYSSADYETGVTNAEAGK